MTNSENKIFVVKASFRACPVDERKQFCKASCIMPISVGQKVHEGDKFIATLKLINAYFKTCTLLIDDTIQRFTLQIAEPSLTIDEAYKKSLQLGNSWLERNKHIYEQLTIPYDIRRWDDWRLHPEYPVFYDKIEKIYATDLAYQQAIHSSIEEFTARYLPRLNENNVDRGSAFNRCLNYMKEECAVMCLWAENKYDFEVYPAGRNSAMTATYEKLIKPIYPNLLHSVALRFKK
jgi:hypothetical protein